jgi:hypothetical protein
MDETAFRAARGAANPQPCVFEKALQAGCAACELAVRHALAEREALACASPVARTNCATLMALLNERSAFALKRTPDAPAPHAVALRLQCGGLAGLRRSVDANLTDVHRLVAAAREHYRSLVDLAWPDIVASVVSWQGRRWRPGRSP